MISFRMSAALIQFIPMADFPNRINALRRAAGLTQAQLAQIVGCASMQISNLENGKRELTLHWMRRIARALGVATSDLLPDIDAPDRLDLETRQFAERFAAATPEQRDTLTRLADVAMPYGQPRPSDLESARKAG